MTRFARYAVLIGSQITLLGIAAPAFAQSYPPSVAPGTSVAGGGGEAGGTGVTADAGGTAFTGGDLLVPVAVVAALVIAGLIALYVARSRRAA
jgi:hypothetical protein